MTGSSIAKYTGPHKPSKEFAPLLVRLYPDPENEPCNIFLQAGEDDFRGKLLWYLKSHDYDKKNDLTIVIEGGAACTELVDDMIKKVGAKGRAFIGIADSYCFRIPGSDYKTLFGVLDKSIWQMFEDGHAGITTPLPKPQREPLNGKLIGKFLPDIQADKVMKEPASSYTMTLQKQVADAMGLQSVPTYVVELTDSPSFKCLYTSVISWLVGSMLMVELLMTAHRTRNPAAVDLFRYDTTVENLHEFMELNIYKGRDLLSMHMVCRYKASRLMMELLIGQFLIDKRRKIKDANDVRELNEQIRPHVERMQQIYPDNQDYTITSEKLKKIKLPKTVVENHLYEIPKDMARYQGMIEQAEKFESEQRANGLTLSFEDAIITTATIIVQRSTTGATVKGDNPLNLLFPSNSSDSSDSSNSYTSYNSYNLANPLNPFSPISTFVRVRYTDED